MLTINEKENKMDLALISSDDLLKELDKRFDTVVFLTERIIDSDNSDIWFHSNGSEMAVIGLCELKSTELKNKKDVKRHDKFGFDNDK